MTTTEKKNLHKQVSDLLAVAKVGDKIVLCIDGEETANDYPYSALIEPDVKSPEGWVNGICFWYDVNEKTCKLSFKLVKS